MKVSSTKTIALIGNVWDPTQGESLKTLIISNGKITRIIDGNGDLSPFPGITPITLDPATTIFPGLINLHTHTTYNILPIWENNNVWKNRFQWRGNTDYKADIGGLLTYIQKNWPGDPENTAYAIISEIQAVAGGTTLIQETAPLENGPTDARSFIIRNTGDPDDLQIPATEQVFSVVDFYKPNTAATGAPDQDTSTWTPVTDGGDYAAFIQSVNNNNSKYYSTLVHVGEGKSGFVKGSTADPYSKKEMDLLFQSLKTDIPKTANLQKANLVLTHGCGIDLTNKTQLQSMAANNISLIWSPVSNLLLYNDTTNVKVLLDNKINICLGSDWSPSGSKHVLDELRFAKFVNDLLGMGISNSELFSMVSANPVKAMGITSTGAIMKNYDADLFVLRKKNATDDALDALLASDDSDIDLVMVNGRIVFGLTTYFSDALQVDFQGFPASEGANIAQRGVSINSAITFDLPSALTEIDTLLQKYCTTVINKPDMKRTKFLASDDPVYRANIAALTKQLTTLYTP